MSEDENLPDFECPFCESMIQQKNIEKHLLKMHQDNRTIHKYVRCRTCKGLFIKHKLTPHVRRAHGTSADVKPA